MICTFLTETSHGSAITNNSLSKLFETARLCNQWTLKDVFVLFYDVLLSYNESEAKIPIVWVLLNFDERATSFGWLLDRLQIFMTDSEFNFKIVTVNSSVPRAALNAAHFKEIAVCTDSERKVDMMPTPPRKPLGTMEPVNQEKNLYETSSEALQAKVGNAHLNQSRADVNMSMRVTEVLGRLEIQILEIVQERPHLYEVRSQLVCILSECKTDPALARLILTWLRSRYTDTKSFEVKKTVSKLMPLSPQKVFHQILSVLLRSEMRKRVIELLELVAHSVRPLSVYELGDLDFKIQDCQGLRTNRTLRLAQTMETSSLLLGLLTVRENEVRFSHHLFRDFLWAQRGDNCINFDETTVALAHARIASICLTYLRSNDGQQLMELQPSSKDTLPFESRLNFLSYALRYWPRHAKLADSEISLNLVPVRGSLNDKATLDLWAKAY